MTTENPPTGTPQGAGVVLGRALLDGLGEMWRQAEGEWRPYRWRRGTSLASSAANVEERYGGPVREVLLVSPEAGRVLEAARVVADGQQKGTQEWLAALRAMYAAVDAMVGDRPTEPRLTGLTATEAAVHRRCLVETLRVSATPAERDEALREALREDAEVDAIQRQDDAEPAPEPDSGAGWDRHRMDSYIEFLENGPEETRDPETAAELKALLADLAKAIEERDLAIAHDRQPYPTAAAYEAVCAALERKRAEAEQLRGELNEMTSARDEVRAELEQVTADRDRLAEQLPREAAARDRLSDELETERARWGQYKRHYLGALDEQHRLRAELERLRGYLASCVWIDPGRYSGQPCLGGTRIPVSIVAGLMRDGLTGDQIRQSYPDVTDGHLAAVQALEEWAGGRPCDALCADLEPDRDVWQRRAETAEAEVERLLGELETVRQNRDDQHAAATRLSYELDQLRADHLRFAAELGFGDGVNEPAAPLADMLDPIKEAMSAAADHDECPVHCELCGETLAATVCQRCSGSGCGPGTASGAYEECQECAGVGRIHEGCAEASYADLVAAADRLRAALATARRDAATDALEYAGRCVRHEIANGTLIAHLANRLHQRADEVRRGERTIPRTNEGVKR